MIIAVILLFCTSLSSWAEEIKVTSSEIQASAGPLLSGGAKWDLGLRFKSEDPLNFGFRMSGLHEDKSSYSPNAYLYYALEPVRVYALAGVAYVAREKSDRLLPLFGFGLHSHVWRSFGLHLEYDSIGGATGLYPSSDSDEPFESSVWSLAITFAFGNL